MSEPFLCMRDIGKAFAGAYAFRGVKLVRFTGEGHALLGKNGAGKSTWVDVTTRGMLELEGAFQLD